MMFKVQWRGNNQEAIINFFKDSQYTPDFNRGFNSSISLTLYCDESIKHVVRDTWIHRDPDGNLLFEKGVKWVPNK